MKTEWKSNVYLARSRIQVRAPCGGGRAGGDADRAAQDPVRSCWWQHRGFSVSLGARCPSAPRMERPQETASPRLHESWREAGGTVVCTYGSVASSPGLLQVLVRNTNENIFKRCSSVGSSLLEALAQKHPCFLAPLWRNTFQTELSVGQAHELTSLVHTYGAARSASPRVSQGGIPERTSPST